MSKEKFQQNNGKKAYYGRNVLHTIIVLAANEISGVVELTAKNVKFESNGTTLNIFVEISLKYGHNASDVAYRVQENIKRSVETMTEYRVNKTDVHICSVALEETD